MLDPEACERRVYRLATALTADPARAMDVLEAVVRAQPRLAALPGPRLDRLTLLRAREAGGWPDGDAPLPVAAGVVPSSADRLAELPEQAREAWVLARVYRLDERETARAMDCSRTAARRHLERAEELLAEAGPPAATALREYLDGAKLPAVRAARLRRARRGRRLLRIGVIAVVIVALLTVVRSCLPRSSNATGRTASAAVW